jgi:hypothetical protein
MTRAQDKKPAAKVTYDDQVAPIIREKCAACHNQDKKSGGLILTDYTNVMQGGSSGKVIEPGDPENSSLYLVVTHQEQPYMPPKSDKLAAEQLETIKQWIAGGALQNVGSKPVVLNKPKVALALSAAPTAKPEGPPPMPEGLILEPAARTARANAITAIASSPWAPVIAVGSPKQVLLYNPDTLDLLGVLPFPEGMPHVLKFSRNGQLLLAGGGRGAKAGRVVVWNVKTGERLFEVGDEFDCVLAADISADQTQIALGGASKTIRVYSTKDGQVLHEIKKHTDWIYAMEYSPDGVLLATADRNGGMFVWESHTGREYASLRGHSAAINDVSWRSDGNVLASGSEDTTIRLWEMENGGQIKSWGAHGGGVASVEYTRDGRIASCGRDRVAKVWDGNGGQQRQFDAFPDIALRCTFSHDGSRVIAGDWSGEIRVWTTADGKLVGPLSGNPPTIAERLDMANKDLAAKHTTATQLAAAAAASKAAADKAAADLALAQKALADLDASIKQMTDAMPKAKESADKSAAALKDAQAALPARQAAAKAVAEAAARATEAADKSAGHKDLVDLAGKAKEVSDKVAAEVAAAEKALTGMAAAAKTAADQFAALQQSAQKAAADRPATVKQVEAAIAVVKPAADKAAADQAAATQAAVATAAARSVVDRWTAAQTAAAKRNQEQAQAAAKPKAG